jgi:glyceraldehyde 3-phosphate dehydrogenase
MALKLAVNGFGRIGRNILRALYESGNSDIKVVAINDLAPIATNAHLFKYDSVHGIFNGDIEHSDDEITINGDRIKVCAERNPEDLPWGDLGVDIALECTGIFTDREKAALHIKAGAKKVLISAPSGDADKMVVFGVNHTELEDDHQVVSNASCTTNCLAPVAKVLHETIGIEQGLMTTIHAFTNDQSVLDVAHKDLRRARSASLSMIPTSTGAAKAVGKVLPSLNGKLDGFSVRVPTPNVSVVDLTFSPSKKTTAEEINAEIEKAANGSLKGVLGYSTAPLVSIDFNHNPHSSVFDATQTRVMEGGNFVKILSWYDNEWGFSNRMLDVAAYMHQLK